MSTAGTPPPGGSSVTLQITVDASTGTLQVKNFGQVLQGLGIQMGAAGAAAGAAGSQAKNSAGGWLELYAQTELVTQGVERYIAVIKEGIIEATMYAARTEVLNTVLRLTASNMNTTTGAAQAQVTAIQKLNITHQEAINTTLQFMRAQLNLADASKLARAAQDLAVVSGQNSSEALATLTEAVQTNREMLLRQFGIVATLPQIFDLYATQVNKSAAALTQHDREQAILNVILTQAGKVTGAYTTAMDDAGKAVTSVTRLHQEAQEAIGKGFVPIMLIAVRAVSSFLEGVRDFATAHQTLVVFFGTFTAAVGAIAAVTASLYTFNAALKVVGITAGITMEGLAAFSVFLATNPYVLAALAIGTLVAAVVTWTAATEGETKAQIENAQTLAGQMEQTKNLVKTYDDLIARKKHLAELESGSKGPSAAEKGNITTIREEMLKRLVIESQTSKILSDQNQFLETSKSLGLDITENDISRGQVQEKLQAAMKTASKDAADSAKNVKLQIDNLEPQLQAAQNRLRDIRSQVNAGGGIAVEFDAMNHAMPLFQEDVQSAQKEVDKLNGTIKSLRDQYKGLTSEMNGSQIRPVDLELAATAAAKVSSYMQLLEQQRHLGIKSTQEMAAIQVQFAGTVTSQLASVRDNFRSVLDQQSKLGLGPAQVELAKEVADAMDKGLQRWSDATSKGTLTAAQMNVELRKAIPLFDQAGQAAKKLPVSITEGLDTQLTLHKQLTETVQSDNRLAVEGLQRQISRNQAELTLLGTRQKSAAEIARTFELQGKIAMLQVDITAKGDVIAGANARTAASAQIQELAARQTREARAQQLTIEQAILAAYTARHQQEGVGLEMEIGAVKERYRIEIEQIKNTTDNAELIKAKVFASEMQRETEITALKWANLQKVNALQLENLQREQAMFETALPAERFAAITTRLQEQKQLIIEMGDERARQENTEQAAAALRATGLTNEQVAQVIKRRQALDIAQANKQAYDFETQALQEIFSMYERINEIRNATAVTEGRIRTADAEASTQIQQIHNQAEMLLRTTTLTREEVDRWVKGQETLIGLQKIAAEQAANQRRLQDAQTIGAGGVLGGIDSATKKKVAHDISEGIKSVRDEVKDAQAALEQATPGTEAYDKALERLANALDRLKKISEGATKTIPDLIKKLSSGEVVTGLDKLHAVFGTIGDAVNTMFDAFMRGDSVGAALQNFVSQLMATIAKQEVVLGTMALAQAIWDAFSPFGDKAAAGPEFASSAQHFAAAALAGAAAAVTSTRSSGGGGGGGGYSGSAAGGTIGQPPQAISPIATKTNTDDNVVRVANAVLYQGAQIAAQGQAYKDVSLQLYRSLQTGSFYMPVLNTMATTLADKVAGAQSTQNGPAAQQTKLLGQIHHELVKANDKSSTMQVDTKLSLDTDATNSFLDGGYVRGTQKFAKQTAASVNSGISQNSNRRETVRALSFGGV